MRRFTPDLRMAGVAIIGAGALLLAACSSTADGTPAPSPTQDPATVIVATNTPAPGLDPAGGGISPATPDEPPGGTFEVGGAAHPLGLGSYCWSPPQGSGNPAVCADAIGYITPVSDTAVTPGDTLEVTGGLAMAPIEIVTARLWLAPEAPVHAGAEFRAWHPGDDAVALTVDGTSIRLPADLEAGAYLLVVDIISIDPSSSAAYGAILTVE
ncbi:MAG: hypothetical protein AMXMBFR23_24910 [Chloroflexota bacterium]